MTEVIPQIIEDTAGKKLVVIPLEEYETLLKIIDDYEMEEDVRSYDEFKKNDDGVRITLEDYLKERGEKVHSNII